MNLNWSFCSLNSTIARQRWWRYLWCGLIWMALSVPQPILATCSCGGTILILLTHTETSSANFWFGSQNISPRTRNTRSIPCSILQQVWGYTPKSENKTNELCMIWMLLSLDPLQALNMERMLKELTKSHKKVTCNGTIVFLTILQNTGLSDLNQKRTVY